MDQHWESGNNVKEDRSDSETVAVAVTVARGQRKGRYSHKDCRRLGSDVLLFLNCLRGV